MLRLRSDCGGDHLAHLLSYVLVLVSSLLTLGIIWYVMQTLPGFVESFGYHFGILLAYSTFDVQRDLD